MEPVPHLTLDRWRLRPLALEDAEPWLAIVLDPELRRLTSWSISSLDEMRGVVRDYVEGARAQSTRRWAIVDERGAFAGTCGFKDWDRAARSAELSYELALEHRGRGAMSAIARVVLEHGASEMQLATICAHVMVDNAPSIRLLERLGFARAATLPALRRCGGELRDFHRYERAL